MKGRREYGSTLSYQLHNNLMTVICTNIMEEEGEGIFLHTKCDTGKRLCLPLQCATGSLEASSHHYGATLVPLHCNSGSQYMHLNTKKHIAV